MKCKKAVKILWAGGYYIEAVEVLFYANHPAYSASQIITMLEGIDAEVKKENE